MFIATPVKVLRQPLESALHAAVGVMDHQPLAGAEQLVRDDEGPDRVVRGATAGIADDMRVALGEPGVFGRIRRASMQVRIANCRAGGSASSPFAPNSRAYF